MKRKIIWLIVSCLMVAALVLASCAPAKVEEEEIVPPEEEEVVPPEEEEVAPPGKEMVRDSLGRLVEKPKYGGTFLTTGSDPLGFDDAYKPGYQLSVLHITHENLCIGDWTKGPAGTGQTEWFAASFDWTALAGCVAESWEIPDAETVIFHIRKGVYWHDKPPVNGREVTAEDVAFNIERMWTTPESYIYSSYPGWLVSVTAPDRYTVVCKGNDHPTARTVGAFENLAEHIYLMPPELIEQYGNAQDWRVSCGTGPFMLVDYVVGSSVTFERSPNYWGWDPLFPDLPFPYLDGMKWLIIPDASTRLSAMRTGKIDRLAVGWEDAKDLMKSKPELLWSKEFAVTCTAIYMRSDTKPFDDVKVRRALAMAIDDEELLATFYGGEGGLAVWPIPPVKVFEGAYTLLEDLPASTKELFEYHPDTAKQLLAEAGYPEGFKTQILATSGYVDILSIMKAYWEKIGVDLEIVVKDSAVHVSMGYARRYTQMYINWASLSQAYKNVHVKAGAFPNWSLINDPFFEEKYDQVWWFENMENLDKRKQLVKEMSLHILDQAYILQMPTPYSYSMWWPWVKNWYNVSSVGYVALLQADIFVQIDQDLKEQMTGRR